MSDGVEKLAQLPDPCRDRAGSQVLDTAEQEAPEAAVRSDSEGEPVVSAEWAADGVRAGADMAARVVVDMCPRVPTLRTNAVRTAGALAAECFAAQPGVHPPDQVTAGARFGRIRPTALTDRWPRSAARAPSAAGAARCLLSAEPAGVAERTTIAQPRLRVSRLVAAAAPLHTQEPRTQLTDHAASLETAGEVPEPAAQCAAGSTDACRPCLDEQLDESLGGGTTLGVAGQQAIGSAVEIGSDHAASIPSRR